MINKLPVPSDKWARVICDEHGPQFITKEEYDRQISDPWHTWKCPCRNHAEWDDEYWEEMHEE